MFFALLLACSSEPKEAPKPESTVTVKPAAKAGVTVPATTKSLFAPLPADMATPERPVTPERVALGRMLYFENRLSKNQELSCNSCHGVESYGVDNKPTSTGHKAQLGGRNSPTSFNAAGHVAQFWDGRAADVEAQAKGPVLNSVEMAMPDEASVVAVLKSIPGYAEPFAKAFPADKDAVTYDNMATAIGAYERTFVTPSVFDRYLAGDETALTDAQKKGLNTFVEVGCATCHSGTYVGGAMYQKAGLVDAWPNQKDLGRFEVTKNEGDKLFFKVPSLRNIEKTGPYFHDGSVASLDEAITMMGKHQLGKTLTPEQVAEIRTFLGALTGTIDPAVVARPELPPSGPKTPKADPG